MEYPISSQQRVRGSPASVFFSYLYIRVTAYQFRAVDSRLTDSGCFIYLFTYFGGGVDFFYIRMTAYYFMLTDSCFLFYGGGIFHVGVTTY